MRISKVGDVAAYQLCCGCGACAYVDPDKTRMVDVVTHGRRPLVTQDAPEDPRGADALAVCPGIEMSHAFNPDDPELESDLVPAWGPIREVWEGYAADSEVRYNGSSGGAATALGLFAIEKSGMQGVLHTAARSDIPYLNHTVFSTTRDEVAAAAGSRYAPASPCEDLQQIEDAARPCMFIGKPCDVAAVQKARELRPGLDAKIGLTIAFFCAGTPSTEGTLEMLRAMGVAKEATLQSLRYRGCGWPGKAVATWQDDGGCEQTAELTYEKAWGDILTRHKQWRCNICPDHTGEFADIAIGDPWYRKPQEDELGQSLILARTRRGQEFLHAAAEAGYIVLAKSEPAMLPASQPNLFEVRATLWGRLLALRLAGVPTPTFRGFPSFRFWWRHLGLRAKVQSVGGTLLRIRRRGLRWQQPTIASELVSPVTQSTPKAGGAAR